jgi:hypothetical protein
VTALALWVGGSRLIHRHFIISVVTFPIVASESHQASLLRYEFVPLDASKMLFVVRPLLFVVSFVGSALCLSGCTSNPDLIGQALVSPGHYDLYDCAQLAKERTTVTARESELRGLIDKAETGVGGQFVAEAAYGPDYATTRENLRTLSMAQEENHCSDGPK